MNILRHKPTIFFQILSRVNRVLKTNKTKRLLSKSILRFQKYGVLNKFTVNKTRAKNITRPRQPGKKTGHIFLL